MKRSRCLIVSFLAVVLIMYLFGHASAGGEKMYRMRGEISAIEPAHDTVVIEVPLKGRMFTVGGPLSKDAVLERGGQPAGLSDFVVGDRVAVKWRATEKGHIIEVLKTE
ncbi:MAG: hypothetical protein HWN68_00280 [Desulfobacterales bacterium]|nr:hypothetical protein [Desulfobacterales bacterium]